MMNPPSSTSDLYVLHCISIYVVQVFPNLLAFNFVFSSYALPNLAGVTNFQSVQSNHTINHN